MTHVHASTMQELNPVGQGKPERQAALEERRARQRYSALVFLSEGLPEGDGTPPPYGKEWSREYNARPYPEATPDQEEYNGTGVGHLYGFDGDDGSGADAHAWQLAGWTLVRTGAEVRSSKGKRHG